MRTQKNFDFVNISVYSKCVSVIFFVLADSILYKTNKKEESFPIVAFFNM